MIVQSKIQVRMNSTKYNSEKKIGSEQITKGEISPPKR